MTKGKKHNDFAYAKFVCNVKGHIDIEIHSLNKQAHVVTATYRLDKIALDTLIMDLQVAALTVEVADI